jgi:hypothetical protein
MSPNVLLFPLAVGALCLGVVRLCGAVQKRVKGVVLGWSASDSTVVGEMVFFPPS